MAFREVTIEEVQQAALVHLGETGRVPEAKKLAEQCGCAEGTAVRALKILRDSGRVRRPRLTGRAERRRDKLTATAEAVVDYILQKGYPPTVREISSATGRALSDESLNLKILHSLGVLEVDPGSPRAIRVVGSRVVMPDIVIPVEEEDVDE